MSTIRLKSSDGESFSIEKPAAKLSLKLKRIIKEKDRYNSVIILDNVNGITLTKVIDYCRKHAISNNNEEALNSFDRQFVNDLDEIPLMYLIDAATNLEIESLNNLCYESLIEKLKTKSLHEIMEMFGREDVIPITETLIGTVLKSFGKA